MLTIVTKDRIFYYERERAEAIAEQANTEEYIDSGRRLFACGNDGLR